MQQEAILLKNEFEIVIYTVSLKRVQKFDQNFLQNIKLGMAFTPLKLVLTQS